MAWSNNKRRSVRKRLPRASKAAANLAMAIQMRIQERLSEQSVNSHLESTKPAPPMDTPTPFNSDPSSNVTTGSMKSPSMMTGRPNPSSGVSARPNVGLLKAQSPWLRKDGICIAVFEDSSVSQLIKGVTLQLLCCLIFFSFF